MDRIVEREQPAFPHQSGPAIPALTMDDTCSPLYIQRLLKAKRSRGQGNGVQGERPYPKRRKGLPLGQPPGNPYALSVPAETACGRCRSIASTHHRPPERADLAGIGRIAAGDTAPAEAAGTHRSRASSSPRCTVRRWNVMPSWSRLSLPPKRITMPTQAACSTTVWKSLPTA